MQKKTLLIALVVYIASSVFSYGVFATLGKPNSATVAVDGGTGSTGTNTDDGDDSTALTNLLTIAPNEPKDQPCPLNGKLYTKTEREAWEKKRPLAVMIENSPDARPQSGLSDADIVFEALAEGGVTRFMAMFYCGVQVRDTTLAPVRSARTYFIDWASGFNYPLYTNVGGANLPGKTNALGQLNDYGWAMQNNLNQFSIGYPTFVRNANRLGKEVATEHTMETTTEKLWAVAQKRGWTNMSKERRIGGKVIPSTDWKAGYKPWTFASELPAPGNTTNIKYEFWDGYKQFGVEWQYDKASNTYKRVMAGEPHLDLNNNQQLQISNVVVLLTDEEGPVDELKHMLYKTIGTGDILVFNNGQVTKAKWSKANREAELTFQDAKGKDLALNPGSIWISVLDKSTKVEY